MRSTAALAAVVMVVMMMMFIYNGAGYSGTEIYNS